MKTSALIAAAVLAAFSVTASASEPTATVKAVHKSHHTKHAKAHRANPYADLEPYRSFGFIGPYPGDYASRKAAGECVIDLGYGRWMSCDQSGGGPFN